LPDKLKAILDKDRLKNKFSDFETIGSGAYGTVFKVTHMLDRKVYAVKKVKLHVAADEDVLSHKALRESQLISSIDSNLIIRYYNCWIEEPTL
jgi:serine/threonine protein kinase